MEAEALDQLMARAQDGDREAFTALVEAVYDDLAAFTALRVPDREALEEVVQETLVAAWRDRASYRREGTLRSWLKGIARHRALRLREERRRAGTTLDADLAAEPPAEEDERLDRLRACMERLPAQARALLTARYAGGSDLAALADAQACSYQTLATRLSRLRAGLRTCMEGG